MSEVKDKSYYTHIASYYDIVKEYIRDLGEVPKKVQYVQRYDISTSKYLKDNNLEIVLKACDELKKYIKSITVNISNINSIYFIPKVRCKRSMIKSIANIKVTRLKDKADIIAYSLQKLQNIPDYDSSIYSFLDGNNHILEIVNSIDFQDFLKLVPIEHLVYKNLEQKIMKAEEFSYYRKRMESTDPKIVYVTLEELCNYSIEESCIYLARLFLTRQYDRSISYGDKTRIFKQNLEEFLKMKNIHEFAMCYDFSRALRLANNVEDKYVEQFLICYNDKVPKGWKLVRDQDYFKISPPVKKDVDGVKDEEMINWEL